VAQPSAYTTPTGIHGEGFAARGNEVQS